MSGYLVVSRYYFPVLGSTTLLKHWFGEIGVFRTLLALSLPASSTLVTLTHCILGVEVLHSGGNGILTLFMHVVAESSW